MKRICVSLLCAAGIFNSAHAQIGKLEEVDNLKKILETSNKDTVAWLHGGVLQVGLNQGMLHNWAAGGEVASMTVSGVFSGYLTRLFHNHIWSNNLDMTYSLFYAYSNRFVPRKIDDRIDFTSKYGIRLNPEKDFYFTTLFNFKSQFTRGYDYALPDWRDQPTSDFMSPAYFILAAGIEYRKGTDISFFLSPAAARLTTASTLYTSRLPEGAFGIKNGETSRLEFGAYFSGRYKVDITPDLMYKTRLDLYTNYLAKDTRDNNGVVVKRDNPGNIDVLWDNLVSWKMTRFVSAVLGLTMIYDNDLPYSPTYIDPTSGEVRQKNEPGKDLGWVQFRQQLTLGFEYRF
jgi:hypothetical protein